MMYYIMSGIELHPDFGFGVTADSYFKSAEFLQSNHYEHYKITPQKEMPQNFLFRHAIELYLKSLIVVFHKKLEINYDQDSFDSEQPKILTGGVWRPLYTCHWIDKLYDYWLNQLLLPNIDKLNEIAPEGDWEEEKDISNLFPIICKYDRDSSFFRYPVTKDTSLDKQKFTMKKFKSVDTLENLMTSIQTQKGRDELRGTTFVKVDEKGKITDAFKEDKKVLENVNDALQKVADYFHCVHIMARVTLCGGM